MNAGRKPIWYNATSRPLAIGLVNNTGVLAMASTRTQFADVLAATGYDIGLLCFTMRAPEHGMDDHLPFDEIMDCPLDAIIVTGMEVTTNDLRDEWLWQGFTRLYDWAERNALPVIWSCLAAHAAVLHSDGITRQPLSTKLSGVYDCQSCGTAHQITYGLPRRWRYPHSRYNGLSADTLVARGYEIISHGDATGVDIFMRKNNPKSFYFQGHPEYKAGTLLQEFLRDMRRYTRGETFTCPEVPAFYLNAQDEADCLTLRRLALAGHNIMPALRTLASQATFQHGWAGVAGKLYANWLTIVAAHISSKSVRTAPVEQGALTKLVLP